MFGGAGVAANLVGGIAAREASRGALGEARNAMIEAQEELNRIGMPPDLSKKIIFEQFQQAGILTPELETEILAGPSKVGEITEDASLRDTQKEALQLLQQRGKGGLTPEDRAALNQIRNEIARDTEAKRQQIMQNFQARGQGGSGAELIAALQASQSGTNQASQEGDRLAAMSSANALNAINQAGTLGGSIRGQDFDVNSARAAAQDALEQFNVQNRSNVQQRNVGARNAAQEANLNAAQNISNANIGMENQERLRQNEAQRTYWQDQAQRQQMRSGAQQQRAAALTAEGQNAAAQAAAPWQMVGSGLSTIGGFLNLKDEKNKKWEGGEISGYSDGGEVKKDFNEDYKKDNRESEYNKIRTGMANQASTFDKLKNLVGYAEGGKVKRPYSFDEFVESLEKAFEKPKEPVHEETLQEKYERIRKQNRRNFDEGYADGGRIMAEDYTHGGEVHGQEVVPGDHPANDTVHAMVSPGEIVVPKTIAQGTIGKKLLKLMQNHHELMTEIDNHNKGK